jgi:hypothetical protein
LGVFARVIPVGKVSVKETPDNATVLELVIVNTNPEIPPTKTGSGEKDLVIAGGWRTAAGLTTRVLQVSVVFEIF